MSKVFWLLPPCIHPPGILSPPPRDEQVRVEVGRGHGTLPGRNDPHKHMCRHPGLCFIRVNDNDDNNDDDNDNDGDKHFIGDSETDRLISKLKICK